MLSLAGRGVASATAHLDVGDLAGSDWLNTDIRTVTGKIALVAVGTPADACHTDPSHPLGPILDPAWISAATSMTQRDGRLELSSVDGELMARPAWRRGLAPPCRRGSRSPGESTGHGP